MKTLSMNAVARRVLSIGSVTLMAVALSGCVSPEQQRVLNLNEDQGTCSDMGARYGSPAHTQCMLRQQQRRDNEHLLFLKQARIHSEMARNAQEMRDNKRD